MNRQRLTALSWLFGAAALVAGCGGGDVDTPTSAIAPPPAPPAPPPAPAPAPAPASAPIAQTEAGIPEGLPTSATIGAAGGTLASSDGRLSISVPAGALAADTAVGIQPITATAPGALGSAYLLTPEGLTFGQPVTLTFTRSAEEAAANAAGRLRVATQQADGRWRVVAATSDAAQRTLTTTTTHFSPWSQVGGLQIRPAAWVLPVSKSVGLRVLDCGEAQDGDLTLLRKCQEDQGLRNWAVNGVAGGNAGSGMYEAPAAVPAQNPVAVSVEAPDALTPLPPAPPLMTTLASHITVVDRIQVYQGTFFGRVVVKIGTEESFYEQSANLRFTRNADLSNAGAEWYDGRGTVHLRARPFTCSEGAASGAVLEAHLQLFNEGPLAGTYQLSVGSMLPINSLTCGDPPRPIDTNLVGGISPAGTDVCPHIAIGDDRGRLAGSWSCNDPGGSGTGRANWTLRAVE